MDSDAGATVQQQYTSTNHAASVSTAPEPTATPSAYTVHHQNQPQHHLLTQHQHQNQPQHHLLTQHSTRTNRNTICLYSTSTYSNIGRQLHTQHQHYNSSNISDCNSTQNQGIYSKSTIATAANATSF